MAKKEAIESALPEPTKKSVKRKKTFKKRGVKRVVQHGHAHIQVSFNNTIITITDAEGNVVAWSSAGGIGFKASILAHLGRIEESKDFLAQYQEKRPAVKNISDYEKVAPTVIKKVLTEGLLKAGMPE